MEKSIDASEEPLMGFLATERARECREKMKSCDIDCHWYQYFATDSFLSLRSGISALRPYMDNLI